MGDLCDYEKERLRRIQENQQFLFSLGKFFFLFVLSSLPFSLFHLLAHVLSKSTIINQWSWEEREAKFSAEKKREGGRLGVSCRRQWEEGRIVETLSFQATEIKNSSRAHTVNFRINRLRHVLAQMHSYWCVLCPYYTPNNVLKGVLNWSVMCACLISMK